MIDDQNGEDRIARAVQQLREEPAPLESRLKLLSVVRTPRRTHPVRWVVAGATAGLSVAAVLLWPQQRALAWSQVVAATRAQSKFHTQSYERLKDDSSWVKVGEEWVDGEKWAEELHSRRTGPYSPPRWIIRYDGKRMFRSPVSLSAPSNTGSVSNFKSQQAEVSDRYSMETFLNRPWFTMDGPPEHVQLDGKDVLRYNGASKGGSPQRTTIYADPKTGVMVRQELYDGSGRMNEYMVIQVVDSIPASQFEPPTSGMKVIDADLERERMHEIMSHGTPFGGGNVLRSVSGYSVFRASTNANKILTLTWTGTPPNPDGTPHARVEGYRVESVFSPQHFGFDPGKTKARGGLFDGQPLYELDLVLDKPVPKVVTLDLPVLVPDRSRPILDKAGSVVGYRSKQIGTRRLVDYKLVPPAD